MIKTINGKLSITNSGEILFTVISLVLCFVSGSIVQIAFFMGALAFIMYGRYKIRIERNQPIITWFIFPLGIFLVNGENSYWASCFLKFLIVILASNVIFKEKISSGLVILKIWGRIGEITAIGIILEKIFPSIFISGFHKIYDENIRTVLSQQVLSKIYYSGFLPEVSIAATIIVMAFLALNSIPNQRVGINRCIEYFILGIALVLTGKKSHIINLVLCCCVMYIIKSKSIYKILRVVKVVLVVAFLASVLIYLNNKGLINVGGISRILDSVNIFVNDKSEVALNQITSGRYSAFQTAWELFIKKPLLGNGWGYFAENYYSTYLGTSVTNVHNIYLQLLCDAGILGFMSFMIPAVLCIVKSMKRLQYKESAQIQAVVKFGFLFQLFFLLYGMTGVNFDVPFLYVNYFASIVMALKTMNMKEYEMSRKAHNIG